MGMRKKALAVLSVGLLLFTLFTPLPSLAAYYGSIRSDKYHYSTCRWAKKIKKKNLIVFKTKAQARENGYRPCKVCKP
ncbi:MAG: Ada metal-binding domain-containing protein [candidate division FCPU426 bacterium]